MAYCSQCVADAGARAKPQRGFEVLDSDVSRITSISILMARRSAEADLLTSWVITASFFVTCLRFPSTGAVTFSLSAAAKSAARFCLGRPGAELRAVHLSRYACPPAAPGHAGHTH
jgi:hypothetical protein